MKGKKEKKQTYEAPRPPVATKDVFDDTTPPAEEPKLHRPKADLVLVPIDAIDDSANIRDTLGDPEAIKQLSESIGMIGMLQPVVLRKLAKGEASDPAKQFRLVSGHRRLAAARLVGETMIEAKLYQGFPTNAAGGVWEAHARLAENVQRQDLNHMELARVFGEARAAGLTVAAIAHNAKLSDDHIRRHLDLLRLCPPVAALVAQGRLPIHQGQLIARVGDPKQQIELTEDCLRLDFDNKTQQWKPGSKPYNAQDGDPEDFIMPPEELRKRVAAKMGGLASCGWLKLEQRLAEMKAAGIVNPTIPDAETPLSEQGGIAGKCSCIGCPDNTTSYGDRPGLFAGIHPEGSDKKGHCTNPACYEAKVARWAEVVEARKKKEQEQVRRQVAEAKKRGRIICVDCASITDVQIQKELGNKPLCPKCAEKARKAQQRGDDYDDNSPAAKAREMAIKERIKNFPSTPEEKLAVAQWQRLLALHALVEKHLAAQKATTPAMLGLTVGILICGREHYHEQVVKQLPCLEELAAGKAIAPKVLAALWKKCLQTNEYHSPHIDQWKDPEEPARNVPLDKRFITEAETIAAVARALGIPETQIPAPPAAEGAKGKKK